VRRLAIFVEGYTELLFINRIISEIAEKNRIAIEQRKIRGGGLRSGVPRTHIEIKAPTLQEGTSHYLLIVDCGGEHLVPQRIREEHENLSQKGYETIVGIRDVYPNFTKADIPKLRQGLKYGIKTSLAPVEFILSVMEIEAWFLAEHNHFPLIHPSITTDSIKQQFGFDLEMDELSDRENPAKDMIDAYSIGGKEYKKGGAVDTLDKLNYDYMYMVLRDRIPDLATLFNLIDEFLTTAVLIQPISESGSSHLA
jgi:hypothetical protein